MPGATMGILRSFTTRQWLQFPHMYLFGLLNNDLGRINEGVVEMRQRSFGILVSLVSDKSETSRVTEPVMTYQRRENIRVKNIIIVRDKACIGTFRFVQDSQRTSFS